jgi:hypothetical protein
MSLSVKTVYGLDLRDGEDSWLIKECQWSEDDFNPEYEPPWVSEQVDDEDGDRETGSAQVARFLLKRLPQDPCGDEINEMYSWELEELLKERTGLSLKSYGYQYGRIFLASGPSSKTHYGFEAMAMADTAFDVTVRAKEQLAWAVQTLGVTFLAEPSVQILVSYG